MGTESIRELISQRLKEARMSSNMTYPQLESLSRVKRSNLSIYENFPKYGKSPSVDALFRIAKSTGKRVGFFFGEDDEQTPLSNVIDRLYKEGKMPHEAMVSLKAFFENLGLHKESAAEKTKEKAEVIDIESRRQPPPARFPEEDGHDPDLFVLGQTAASSINAIEHFDNGEFPEQTMRAPRRLVGQGDRFTHYILRVVGNSMEKDNIYDGNYVVVRFQKNVNPGDIAVCVWDDGINGTVCTLKRVLMEENRIVLRSSSFDRNAHPDVINPVNLQIMGRCIGTIPRA